MESALRRQGNEAMGTGKNLHFLSDTNAGYKQLMKVQQWPGLCTI